MDLVTVFIFLFLLEVALLRRERPSSSREAKNHPKKCDPQKRFLIHLVGPGSSCLRSREAPTQRRSSYTLRLSFSRRCVGTSRDVIGFWCIKSRSKVSSQDFSGYADTVTPRCVPPLRPVGRLCGILQVSEFMLAAHSIDGSMVHAKSAAG